jgi:hypothetical protein
MISPGDLIFETVVEFFIGIMHCYLLLNELYDVIVYPWGAVYAFLHGLRWYTGVRTEI